MPFFPLENRNVPIFEFQFRLNRDGLQVWKHREVVNFWFCNLMIHHVTLVYPEFLDERVRHVHSMSARALSLALFFLIFFFVHKYFGP